MLCAWYRMDSHFEVTSFKEFMNTNISCQSKSTIFDVLSFKKRNKNTQHQINVQWASLEISNKGQLVVPSAGEQFQICSSIFKHISKYKFV